MALIKCPECGREVSDRAGVCPNCAFPLSSLRQDGTVSIKIANGLAGTVNICELPGMNVLWSGKAGQIAKFEITHPIEIGIRWGMANKPYATTHVEAGKKYELAWRQGFLASSVCINEVDVLDSGR